MQTTRTVPNPVLHDDCDLMFHIPFSQPGYSTVRVGAHCPSPPAHGGAASHLSLSSIDRRVQTFYLLHLVVCRPHLTPSMRLVWSPCASRPSVAPRSCPPRQSHGQLRAILKLLGSTFSSTISTLSAKAGLLDYIGKLLKPRHSAPFCCSPPLLLVVFV
jgi:hypothetical protein